MATSIWDTIYQQLAALKNKGRLFVRSGTSYAEVLAPVTFSDVVVTDSTGTIVVDYSGMGFTKIYDVFITPITGAKGAGNAITTELVGTPSLTSMTIQTYKPAVIALGGLSITIATAVTLMISVRGAIAST